MSEVTLQTDKPYYPKRYDKRLCFPVGQFNTVLCGDELDRALRENHIIGVGNVCAYDADPLFDEYVNFYYSKRLEYRSNGNDAFAFMCKILLNSLYGKWGQLADEWQEFDGKPQGKWSSSMEWDIEDQKMVSYRERNGIVEVSKGKIESFNSFPAISAFVTSNARSCLLSIIEAFGSARVLYCDTDSVFVAGMVTPETSPYPIGPNLGELKVEQTSNSVDIFTLKDYVFGSDVKIKGVNKLAKRIDANTFEVKEFEGINGAMKRDNMNRQIVRDKRKHLSRTYNKGVVNSDGKVEPFSLSEPRGAFALSQR